MTPTSTEQTRPDPIPSSPRTILEARHLVPIATVIEWRPHVNVVLDDAAAGSLKLGDYYRSAFANKPKWQTL